MSLFLGWLFRFDSYLGDVETTSVKVLEVAATLATIGVPITIILHRQDGSSNFPLISYCGPVHGGSHLQPLYRFAAEEAYMRNCSLA